MDFNYEIDIDVPRDYAFERFTDINEIGSTLPANIVLRAESGDVTLKEGSVWVVKAQRSGRNFVIRNTITQNQPPERLVIESVSNRMESQVNLDFEETGSESCKIVVSFDIKPKGLLGRILVQSIKASQKRIVSSLDSGSARLRETFEADYREQD